MGPVAVLARYASYLFRLLDACFNTGQELDFMFRRPYCYEKYLEVLLPRGSFSAGDGASVVAANHIAARIINDS